MRVLALAIAVLSALLFSSATARANGRFPAAQHLWGTRTALGDTIALRSTFGFVVSDDGGATFHYVCEDALGYGDRGFLDPPFVLDQSGRMYVGLTSGLRRVGSTRCEAPSITSFDNAAVGDLDALPDGRTVLAAVTRGDGSSVVVRSDDGGEHFTVLGNGVASLTLTTLEVAPSDPRVVYLTGYGADHAPRLYVSHDGGATLDPLAFDGSNLEDAWIAGIDPTNANTVFVRARLFATFSPDGGTARPTALLRSRDGGVHWSEVTRTRGAMLGFAIDDSGRGVWIGSAAGDGLVRSLDGGDTWSTVAMPRVQCLRWFAGSLYVCGDWSGDGYAIARSRDQGTTLEPMLRFDQVRGAFDCLASTTEGSICASRWRDLERQFFALDASSPSDAAAPADVIESENRWMDAAHADVPPTGAESAENVACNCTTPGRHGRGFAVLAVFAALLARRTRRA